MLIFYKGYKAILVGDRNSFCLKRETNEKTDVDKIDLDKPIKAYMAKPDKTLGEHYEDFLRQAEILWNLGYISSEHMYDLLKECGCHHDDGKVNLPFQMRVNDKSGK